MEEATFLHHEACPSCSSSDALARYSDGHGFCFACEYYEDGDDGNGHIPNDDPVRPSTHDRNSVTLVQGAASALPKRNITEETAAKWGYEVGTFSGKPVQIANYCDEAGKRVKQKLRFANKDFTVVGDKKASTPLYGQWLWRDKGKMVVVTEGEIDALSVSQLQGNKWPVVSVPDGAQGAKKAVAKALDWLEGFESVIFMLDNDDQGRKAAQECAALLAPGRAKIATLPLKDANAMLQANRGKEVIDAIWGAKTYRPDGVVSGIDLWAAVSTDLTSASLPYPWPQLNEKTRGMRRGELVTWTAGSGIGKTEVVREVAHKLHRDGETVGLMMLEENTRRTGLGLMGIELNKPLHLSKQGVSDEELKRAFDATLGTGRLYLYDHFGSTDIDNLMSRLRYLAKGVGCNWLVLDHLSIIVSGIGDGDERRLIDNTMTQLRTFVEETGVGLHLVSHLKRPEGRGHEEGARTALGQLRGSHAIAQLSDIVIGLERDQQGDNPNVTTVRVLKNRFSGETGEAGYLEYDRETGRLHETSLVFGDETGEDDKLPF